LVEALRYKLEDRRFDSQWCHWNFLLTQSFRPHYGPGVDSASNRNEQGKGKGKAIPLQAWTGPEGSRRLRLPDFKTFGT